MIAQRGPQCLSAGAGFGGHPRMCRAAFVVELHARIYVVERSVKGAVLNAGVIEPLRKSFVGRLTDAPRHVRRDLF